MRWLLFKIASLVISAFHFFFYFSILNFAYFIFSKTKLCRRQPLKILVKERKLSQVHTIDIRKRKQKIILVLNSCAKTPWFRASKNHTKLAAL
jgi:hypothetical protein